MHRGLGSLQAISDVSPDLCGGGGSWAGLGRLRAPDGRAWELPPARERFLAMPFHLGLGMKRDGAALPVLLELRTQLCRGVGARRTASEREGERERERPEPTCLSLSLCVNCNWE